MTDLTPGWRPFGRWLAGGPLQGPISSRAPLQSRPQPVGSQLGGIGAQELEERGQGPARWPVSAGGICTLPFLGHSVPLVPAADPVGRAATSALAPAPLPPGTTLSRCTQGPLLLGLDLDVTWRPALATPLSSPAPPSLPTRPALSFALPFRARLRMHLTCTIHIYIHTHSPVRQTVSLR